MYSSMVVMVATQSVLFSAKLFIVHWPSQVLATCLCTVCIYISFLASFCCWSLLFIGMNLWSIC